MTDSLNKEETQELLDDNPHLGIIDRHAETVSKAKLVLIVLCMVAIVISFVLTKIEFGGVSERISNSEPPCLRYGSDSPQCHESFQAAIDSITDYQLCDLLSKRPDLTDVESVDCRRIAREVRRQHREAAKRRPSGESPVPHSRGSRSPAPAADNQQAGSSAPKGDVGSSSPDSDHQAQNQPSPQTQAPQEQQSSQTPPAQDASSQVSDPPRPSAGSANQPSASAPSSSSSNPPVVGVEAPKLPVQACVPGVISVNCP